MVEVNAKRTCNKFIRECFSWQDHILKRRTIHTGRMKTVKVSRVRFRTGVYKRYLDDISFSGADSRAWDLTIICPCREENSWSNLDTFVLGDECVLSQRGAIRERRFFIKLSTFFCGEIIKVPGS